MQHAEAVPAVLDGAELDARPWRRAPRPPRRPAAPARPAPTMISGRSAFLQHLGEACLAGGELGQRLRAGAEIVVGVGQIGLLADQRRSGNCPARQRLRMRALSTGASRRGLEPTISSASACSMPAMVGVEQVARAAACADRAPRRPGGSRCSATPSRVIRSLSANISSTAARSPAIAPMRVGRCGLRPCAAIAANASRQVAGAQPAVLADIGLVEPLRAQPVDDVAGLVGNPLLVHVVVDARQDAHHLAAARIDADRRAERVHHVDRFGLGRAPTAAPRRHRASRSARRPGRDRRRCPAAPRSSPARDRW